MIVISHRGLWQNASEKNTRIAFERSFAEGFGTETDVRDHRGRLVIAHDVPTDDEEPILFEDFLQLAQGLKQPLAINIKSDGLATMVREVMAKHGTTDWFVFDMSIPDMRHQLAAGNPTFTRMSEVEQVPVWSDRCVGIWLDGFDGTWFNIELIRALLAQGKRVCVVSPELHQRPHQPLWEQLREVAPHSQLILCTDLPRDAQAFFKETA